VLLLDALQELLVGVYGVGTGGQGWELELGLLQNLACGGEGKGCGIIGMGLVGFQGVWVGGELELGVVQELILLRVKRKA
jgi:hypothetical protein